jgi:hypothetical protein
MTPEIAALIEAGLAVPDVCQAEKGARLYFEARGQGRRNDFDRHHEGGSAWTRPA